MNSIKKQLTLLPDLPGCYLMKNASNQVIYVGKAKNLKNRVRSYFVGAHNEKTTKLVSEIHDFSYIVTRTEHESLILELNLIKQYSPRFNIRLMDDKTYPYIELTDETYPKLQIVRQKQSNSRIFGPYPNVYAARETVRLLNQLYPLRKCDTLPNKTCLYFHIGQCLAPCVFKDVNYDHYVSQIINFLKGDTKEVLKKLQENMVEASEKMLFEKAAEYRDMIHHIEHTTEKQLINLNDGLNRDVIAYASNDTDCAVEIFKLRDGKLIDHIQTVFNYTLDPNETILSYLNQLYETDVPDELCCHISMTQTQIEDLYGSKVIFPQKGDKHKLTLLAHKNAVQSLEHHFMLNRHQDDQKHLGLQKLSQTLTKDVTRIDVFDNAQLFGTAPISAVIVYDTENFEKKSYRKYHLKTTTNDDYQAMREVTYRRYQKLMVESGTFPDVILVDGGLGQVHAAEEVITELGLEIPVCGLKKNKRHQLEGLVYLGQTKILKPNDVLFKFLIKLSEEVHRFAITFHRKTRDKLAYASKLDDIEGIGPKRKARLIQQFGTFERIQEASFEALKQSGLPEALIKKIKEHA